MHGCFIRCACSLDRYSLRSCSDFSETPHAPSAGSSSTMSPSHRVRPSAQPPSPGDVPFRGSPRSAQVNTSSLGVKQDGVFLSQLLAKPGQADSKLYQALASGLSYHKLLPSLLGYLVYIHPKNPLKVSHSHHQHSAFSIFAFFPRFHLSNPARCRFISSNNYL